MRTESGVGTGYVGTGVVQHGHHDVAGTVIFERNVERDVHPAVRTGIGEINGAVKDLEHLVSGNPVGAAAERALVGVAHIDHNVLVLSCIIDVLEGNAVDGAVDGSQFSSCENLLGIRIVVEGVQRKNVLGCSTVAHYHAVQAVHTGVVVHGDRNGDRVGFATVGIFRRHVVGVVAIGHGIQIGSCPGRGEKNIVTVEIVTGKDVGGFLQIADNNPVVVCQVGVLGEIIPFVIHDDERALADYTAIVACTKRMARGVIDAADTNP